MACAPGHTAGRPTDAFRHIGLLIEGNDDVCKGETSGKNMAAVDAGRRGGTVLTFMVVAGK